MESLNNLENLEEDEYIEEEMLVYVDIEPTSLTVNQIKNASCFKIVGNDKNAIIQVDGKFFEGEYDYSIGTHVFFEKDEETPVDELYSRCDCHYKFISKTNKTLKMNRILLKDLSEKDTNDDDIRNQNIENINNTLKATRTYEQALNLFLPKDKNPPRKITGEDEKISLEIVNKYHTTDLEDMTEKEIVTHLH
ncbi:hypothetical protein PVAND_010326 [Polypedilum vanderplanki]|uniref:Transcription factor TFIIIC triple barrel domain-containing protein n=1 Tax=Polypedilum vanderplanki TaxID=319348 RepID=A0A9J6CFX5_POLVA|nr:hypothetical protein PVAND_010326 [Polypedilum vanderplanki]